MVNHEESQSFVRTVPGVALVVLVLLLLATVLLKSGVAPFVYALM